MEKEILFVSLYDFDGKEGKHFYKVDYVCDNRCVSDFVNLDVYQQLTSLGLKTLTKYRAIFNMNISTKRISIANVKIN